MSGLSLLLLSRCLRKDTGWRDDETRREHVGEGGGIDISLLKGNVSNRWCNSEESQAINNVSESGYRAAREHRPFRLYPIDPTVPSQTCTYMHANRSCYCSGQRAAKLVQQIVIVSEGVGRCEEKRLKVAALTCRVQPRKCPGPAVLQTALENTRRRVSFPFPAQDL